MNIRPSPISGRWYPDNPDMLARSVDEYMDHARQEAGAPSGSVVGLVAPHAGHIYSGPVAGYAFNAVRGAAFDRVAVLCPSHFHADGSLLTSGHAAYATPLGDVPVDRPAAELLRSLLAQALGAPESKTLVEIRGDREHAIEIELPFLQRALAGEFSLLPIMLRDQSPELVQALGAALARALEQLEGRALIVASSDLSHYFPQAVALKLDQAMLEQIDAFDPAGVLRAEADGLGQACGHGAIAAGLWAMRALGADHARVVKHATSGDVSGDYDQVVGYAAAVVWKAQPAA